MTVIEIIVIGCTIVLIVLPCRYDPAIRWKERNEARKRKSR
jgi:hypothetical protein